MSTVHSNTLRSALAACLTALAATAPSTAAAAATLLDYVSGAVAQTRDSTVLDIGQKTSSQATSGFSNATSNESAFGSSNLASGAVRGRIESEARQSTGGDGAFMSSFIGDGFQHLSGTDPFDWSGQSAAFRVRIDGFETINPGPGDVFNFAVVYLMIYRKGTLDDFVPFCNAGGYDNVLANFFWSIGSGVSHPCGGTFVGNLSGNVDTELLATFQPGADFDWAFGLRLGGGFNANIGEGKTEDAFWLQDFASTATLTYDAPAGTIVISRSGVFPGTQAAAVPVPGTLALAALGLVALAARRRPARRR